MTKTNLAPDFGVQLTADEFDARWLNFHKQLFASTEHNFADVCTHVLEPQPGMSQYDHSFIVDDGGDLHLFYATGDQSRQPEMRRCMLAGDWEGAGASTCEPGNGHAVGQTLFDLQFRENLFFEPQGRFDLITRAVCSMFRYEGRYGMLYDVRGVDENDELYIGMSLAWSSDLDTWELDEGNPAISPPPWAATPGTCKDPHVLLCDGLFLIYYIVVDEDGYCVIALTTTTDWQTFVDEGAIMRLPSSLRGTMGIESPCVFRRDGMWHLFFTYGPGLHHAVSPSPTAFVGERPGVPASGKGCYNMGPFHAPELFEHDGHWWLTTDRKEETRRLNRVAGRLCYRGSFEDEKTLHEGLYVSEVVWKGDQPTMRLPERS